MTFDKIKLNHDNHFIKKVKCSQDGPVTSDSGSMKKNKSIQDMIIDGELTSGQAITEIKNKLRRKSELLMLKDGKKKKL